MMTLLDEYSRPSLAIQVERQITGAEVLRVVEQTMIHYGVPGYIRSDNGPEFIATTVQQWLNKTVLRRSILIRVVQGKMDILSASIVVSATNV